VCAALEKVLAALWAACPHKEISANYNYVIYQSRDPEEARGVYSKRAR
jgi:hypothetical protein